MTVEPIEPGALIEKVNSDPGDLNPDGARGTVVERLGPLPAGTILPDGTDASGHYGYFVKWACLPDLAVFVSGPRIRIVRPM